jgi:hypothetical protein
MEDWDYDDKETYNKMFYRNNDSSNGLPQNHWWVEIENYIIDVTEDQFHPDEEENYRIGIYTKKESSGIYNTKFKKHN